MQLGTVDISSESVLSRMKGRGNTILSIITANPKITLGLSIILFFILMAIFAPLLTRYDPNSFAYPRSLHPTWGHLFGTTRKGEDVFAQVVYGARITLTVGFISAIGSTLLQVLFGLTAGFFGGITDEVLSLITNVFLVLPGLPLAIVLASFAPFKGIGLLILVLLFTTWSYGARVLRAQTLTVKEREFVAAARASGENSFRIIFAEILPNEIALVASNFVGTFVYVVLTEVALEFLGLGDISQSSWGVMLYWAQSQEALLANLWWWFVPPGLCVAILCAGLTFLNFGIDELANPRLRRERPPKASSASSEVHMEPLKADEMKKDTVTPGN